MKRSKKLFAFLLTIFSLVLIVFIGFMQQQFNNPEFTELAATTQTSKEDESDNTDVEEDVTDNGDADSDAVAGAAGSVVESEEEAERETETDSQEEESNEESNEEANTESETEESAEVTYSTRTVTAETLNARSGPGIDYDITGVLVLGQTVEVEDTGDEWVSVAAGEITGYVNERYLSEEE